METKLETGRNLSPDEVALPHNLSADEVATFLGLGRTKTYEMLASGEIPSFKIGRVKRVRREDLEKYVEQQLAEEKN